VPALALPHKTDRCRQALLDRRMPLSQAHRAFLIMVDGKRRLEELGIAMAMLGLGDADLQALTEAGLLTWQVDAAAATPAPASM
jgi:hypothetical protein